MTCDPEVLVDYLYGELAPETRTRLEEHLATCASCRSELEELGGTARLLRAWPEESAGPGLVFVAKPAARGFGWLGEWLRPGWRLALVGLSAAAAVLLLVADFHAEYRDGRLSLALELGGSAAAATGPDRPATVGDLLEMQQQSLSLLAAAVQEGGRRNRQDLELAVVGLARQLEEQRYRDLQALDRRLVELDWQSETRFRRNENVLERLVPAVVRSGGYP